MRRASSTKKNTAPAIVCSAPWRLKKVTAKDDYKIEVEFIDGSQGVVDMKFLIHSPSAGVFAQLRDVQIFKQVYLCYGVATWPGEIDLSPDAMHSEIKKQGQWVVK